MTRPASLPPPSGEPAPAPLAEVYHRLRTDHGHQRWWPAETPFEVCIGAILTQNTSWRNVERALNQLRQSGALEFATMLALTEAELAERIRPAGCFRVKARRLRAFLAVLADAGHGRLAHLFAGATPNVRARLLAIPGIGPETADCLLLYAGGHLSFVVDAYTRRIFHRHGWCSATVGYAELQRLCARSLPAETAADPLDLWQDCHAQLVRIGKDFCRPRTPRCEECPLRGFLPAGPPR